MRNNDECMLGGVMEKKRGMVRAVPLAGGRSPGRVNSILIKLEAEGVKCMDGLARFAKQERFDVCGILKLSRDSIRHALNRRFGVPQPAELRYLSTFRT